MDNFEKHHGIYIDNKNKNRMFLADNVDMLYSSDNKTVVTFNGTFCILKNIRE